MEINSSISYIMPNLLIGLCKSSKYLQPYSTIFHEQLGYDFFRLELLFQLSSRNRISPDAILISTKLENTLLFEWTEAVEVSSRKQNQQDHYANVTSSDLANFAAVPAIAAKTFDIVLTLRPSAIANFQSNLSSNSRTFPILELDQQDLVVILSKVANSFQVAQTDDFFIRSIRFERLPRYIPFSLETNQPREMVPFVIQHLVSLLVKREIVVSLPDFCKGFIPAWDLIGREKKSELSGTAKGLINDLVRKRWGSQLAQREGDNPPTWALAPDVFKKNSKGFRKQLIEFIAEVRGETYQPGLDFGAET